jgi:hypothetical protein
MCLEGIKALDCARADWAEKARDLLRPLLRGRVEVLDEEVAEDGVRRTCQCSH